jgi:uncharacterized protein
MKPITNKTSLVVLQPTSYCNLNCSYCYLGDRQSKNLMSQAQKEIIFERVLSSMHLENRITLCWHAGEPLSAGLKFYEDTLELIGKFKKDSQQVVTQSFQTNGTLIDDAWCDYFKKTNANVGVSVDGPDFIHNKNRVNWKGKGTHAFTMRGIKKLQEHGVKFHTISVLSAFSLDYPDEMFDFFFSNKMTGQVCFNFEEYESNNTTSYYKESDRVELLLEKYKAFYSRFYDLLNKYEEPFQVREFESLKSNLISFRYNPERTMASDELTAFRIVTIDHRGDVYTFSPELAGGYLEQNFSIGNINEVKNLDDLRESTKLLTLKSEIDAGVKKCKDSCTYFDFCGGGGASNKFSENGTFDSAETRYCKFHKQGLIDLMAERLQSKESLLEGVQILDIDTLMEDRLISISSGIDWAIDTPISSYYLDKSKIPKSNWRKLTAEEAEKLRYTKQPEDNFSKSVGLIKIPEHILSKTLLDEIHYLKNSDDITPSYLSARLTPYKDRLIEFLMPMTLDDQLQSVGYYFRNSDGLPTVTLDSKRNNSHLGLHVDSWEENGLDTRHKSRPRVCINLGLKERYFVYINLSLKQMYALINGVEHEKNKIRNAQNEIIHTFMEQNPNYPVLKIRIDPLHAYIAPTENIIHDGYHSHAGIMDITWTFFGQFSAHKVSTYHEQFVTI